MLKVTIGVLIYPQINFNVVQTNLKSWGLTSLVY